MTQLRRRDLPFALLGVAATRRVDTANEAARWSAEWDQALIGATTAAADLNFDPGEAMLARRVGAEYSYHSALRNTVVHPTRESLEYALLLLELGHEDRVARAHNIIDHVLSLQESDPKNKFYGIWGYYLEEPPARMSPADFNWADFNGSSLLIIEFRHGERLPAALRARVRESIRHAAYSVRRRNVSMTYTNIAVQGTFVTLAAAQLLGDQELWNYAVERQRRFAATVDEAGSFAEYNSPTYANVTIANLTRIRMFVKDAGVLELNQRLHERIWLHLAKHWHFPTRQLAGPMSRCYSTDIGRPLWLQKALGGRLPFATLDEIRSGAVRGSGEIGITEYSCPESIAPYFLRDQPPRQHRELFTPTVQGTTWLERDFCLGSANRTDFWIQRRGLLAYWGGPERPARYAQLRFLKDDYDFASALLYTTQEKDRVLGLVNFRSPGGDKHVSIDVIKNGAFRTASLRLALMIADPGATIRIQGRKALVDLGDVALVFELRGGSFGGADPSLRIGKEDGRAAVIVDLFKKDEPVTIRWREIEQAYVTFTLAMSSFLRPAGKLSAALDAVSFESQTGTGTVALRWGDLELAGATRVAPQKEQDAAFRETRRGQPVEAVRLANEHLL